MKDAFFVIEEIPSAKFLRNLVDLLQFFAEGMGFGLWFGLDGIM